MWLKSGVNSFEILIQAKFLVAGGSVPAPKSKKEEASGGGTTAGYTVR